MTSPCWYSLSSSECIGCQHTNAVSRLQVCNIRGNSFDDTTEFDGSCAFPGLDLTRENVDILYYGSAFAHSVIRIRCIPLH